MCVLVVFFYFKQKTAYEMRISDWSSDVCSSDLPKASASAARWPTRCAPARRWSAWWRTAWHEIGVDMVPALPAAGLRVPGRGDRRRLRHRARAGGVLPAGRAVGRPAGHGGEHAGVERGADGQLRAGPRRARLRLPLVRSEEHTSELQSLMRISYAVFCLKQKKH